MATTTHESGQTSVSHDTGTGHSIFKTLVFLVIVSALIFGGVTYYPDLVASLSTDAKGPDVLTYTVSPERLLVTVTEDGNVESASNVEVKCLVAGGSTILWIVPDGETVEAGTEIVRLDTANIEDQLNNQRITYEKALATRIQSEEDFEAATIAVKEYEEGTFLEELQKVEADIRIAMENLTSSKNVFEHTKKMARKGFVTKLQREADKFAVERAGLDLAAANTRKKVLEQFTKAKTLKDLVAKREASAARMRADEAALSLEKARRDRLASQLGNCVIKAPQSGMVVYANNAGRSRYGGNQTPQVEEGAMVREGQALIRLPDLKNMQVKVTVHESKVDQLRRGMPARIVIQDQEHTGRVVHVANQPESTSWFSANVKEYATTVAIAGNTTGLKPGMTAEVEILVADRKDVPVVPVSAVVEQRGKFFCWVQTQNGRERRPLKLGLTNDKLIEVVDGVVPGDEVLRNPRAVEKEAREDVPLEDRQRDRSAFGDGETSDGGDSTTDDSNRPEGGAGRSPDGRRDGAGNQESRRGDEQEPRGGPLGEGRRGGGRRGGGRRGGFDLMQYDTDSDGKVSKEEAPERMRGFFDRIDGNGDGFIDKAEIDAMRARFQGGRGGRQGDGRGGAGRGEGGGYQRGGDQPGGGNPRGDRGSGGPGGRGQ